MKVILQKQKVEEKKNTAWVLNRMKSVLRLRSAKGNFIQILHKSFNWMWLCFNLDDAASEVSGSVVPPIPILPARNIKVSGRSPQSSKQLTPFAPKNYFIYWLFAGGFPVFFPSRLVLGSFECSQPLKSRQWNPFRFHRREEGKWWLQTWQINLVTLFGLYPV